MAKTAAQMQDPSHWRPAPGMSGWPGHVTPQQLATATTAVISERKQSWAACHAYWEWRASDRGDTWDLPGATWRYVVPGGLHDMTLVGPDDWVAATESEAYRARSALQRREATFQREGSIIADVPGSMQAAVSRFANTVQDSKAAKGAAYPGRPFEPTAAPSAMDWRPL